MAAEFDLPARTFDFPADLDYGLAGEALVVGFLDCLQGGAFEVKSDRYRNGRMVIETNQNPRGRIDTAGNRIWELSGINITTAKWWVYIYSPSGGFVIVAVDRLKKYLRLNRDLFNESTKINLGGSDNPARGFLLMPNHVIDLLTNQNYD